MTTGKSNPFADFKPELVDPTIPEPFKEAMLELILIWAKLDTGLGLLSALYFGMDPTAGAIIFNRMRVSERLHRVRALQVELGRTELAAQIKRIQRSYEAHSKPRNLIAHAYCAGIYKSGQDDLLVFMPFEAEGGHGQLCIEGLTLKHMQRATEWGERTEANVKQMLASRNYPGA